MDIGATRMIRFLAALALAWGLVFVGAFVGSGVSGVSGARAMDAAQPAAELVMIEEAGCVWCARWHAEIGAIYPKTPEGAAAPLRRIDIRERRPDDLSFARPVSFTPTFVLMRDGVEAARIEGYPGEDFFWGLLGMHLKAHVGFQGAS